MASDITTVAPHANSYMEDKNSCGEFEGQQQQQQQQQPQQRNNHHDVRNNILINNNNNNNNNEQSEFSTDDDDDKSNIFTALDLHKGGAALNESKRCINRSWSSPSGQTLPPQAHGQQHSAPILSPSMSGFPDHGRTMIPDRYSDPTGMEGSRISYNDRMLSLDMNGLSGAGIPGHPNKMLVRNIKSYHCRMCEQEFENKSDMQRHAKEIHRMEEKGHKCAKCFKSFPSSQQLAQHTLVHSNFRKYPCRFCDKAFKQLSHVQQHQRIHTGERPYRCAVEGCSKAFRQLSSLQQHIKGHNVPLPKSYPISRVSPNTYVSPPTPTHKSNEKLNSSLARPHDLTCQVCEKQCADEVRFFQHIHKYHPDYWRVFSGGRPLTDFIEVRDFKSEMPEKCYVCTICEKDFGHESAYWKHVATSHPNSTSPTTGGSPLVDDASQLPRFNCTVCLKLFAKESYLLRHLEMNPDAGHCAALDELKKTGSFCSAFLPEPCRMTLGRMTPGSAPNELKHENGVLDENSMSPPMRQLTPPRAHTASSQNVPSMYGLDRDRAMPYDHRIMGSYGRHSLPEKFGMQPIRSHISEMESMSKRSSPVSPRLGMYKSRDPFQPTGQSDSLSQTSSSGSSSPSSPIPMQSPLQPRRENFASFIEEAEGTVDDRNTDRSQRRNLYSPTSQQNQTNFFRSPTPRNDFLQTQQSRIYANQSYHPHSPSDSVISRSPDKNKQSFPRDEKVPGGGYFESSPQFVHRFQSLPESPSVASSPMSPYVRPSLMSPTYSSTSQNADLFARKAILGSENLQQDCDIFMRQDNEASRHSNVYHPTRSESNERRFDDNSSYAQDFGTYLRRNNIMESDVETLIRRGDIPDRYINALNQLAKSVPGFREIQHEAVKSSNEFNVRLM